MVDKIQNIKWNFLQKFVCNGIADQMNLTENEVIVLPIVIEGLSKHFNLTIDDTLVKCMSDKKGWNFLHTCCKEVAKERKEDLDYLII